LYTPLYILSNQNDFIFSLLQCFAKDCNRDYVACNKRLDLWRLNLRKNTAIEIGGGGVMGAGFFGKKVRHFFYHTNLVFAKRGFVYTILT